MGPEHDDTANLASLSKLTSLSLYVATKSWPFGFVRHLPNLKTVTLQSSRQEAWQAAAAPLLQQQPVTSLLLWCESYEEPAPAPQVGIFAHICCKR